MPTADNRLKLSKLIGARMAELNISCSDFEKRGGFRSQTALTSLLRGYARLPVEQVERVVEALDLNPLDCALLALSQFHEACFINYLHSLIGEHLSESEQDIIHVIRAASLGAVPPLSDRDRSILIAMFGDPGNDVGVD